MRSRAILLLLVVVLTVPILGGCGASNDDYVVRNQARDDVESKTGKKVDGISLDKCGDGMSESHRMLASMILSGNSMDPDLGKYEDLYLAKITLDSGEEMSVLVHDGRTIFPAETYGGGE